MSAPAIDPNDGLAVRVYYNALLAQLQTVRASWDSVWRDLGSFFAPRSTRFDTSEVNRGERKDYDIINETGPLALRTLKAGMLTGMSSPTRAWLKIGDADAAFNAKPNVRAWCEDAEDRLKQVLLKSNAYESLLTLYGEEGLFGTSAFLVLEDEKTVIRCHPFPVGSYYIAVDDTLRIDLAMRQMRMTVRQIVERFGRASTSDTVLGMYDSNSGGSKETQIDIVHVIHKGTYFGPSGIKPAMEWVSTWYEKGAHNQKTGILRRSGFLENPLICGRWSVVGENAYGESPALDCLGSVMSLQAWEARTAQAVEKQIDPTMIASTAIDPLRATTLPGEILFADTKDVSNVFTPAYHFEFKLEGALSQIQRIEQRIDDAMYRSLFQMFSESDRKDITAEEIRARAQEKMQVLGPVVERNVQEVLAPLVMRTLKIMERRGLLPPLPQEMKGRTLNLEFISILAQAQKLGSINSLQQLMAFVGNEVAVDQGILDVVDLDASVREFADLADVPSKLIRSDEQVQAIRADRQRQQQQQQAADNAQKLAAAAQNLSQTKTGTGSLLDQALPALAGGGE